jgi:hypothetical protein
MASILIAGGFDDTAKPGDPIPTFVRALAAEVIRQNHVLLGGCQTGFDAEAVKSAAAACAALGKQPEDWIISYVGKGATPVHDIGSVRQSQLPRWDLLGPKLIYPEPVAQADAVILVGGWEGTRRAANWARLAGKPILPVATFGLAAAEVYDTELQEFKTRYSTRIRKNDYELLNSVVADESKMEPYSKRVVSLAERIITPRNVFVIMSFTKDPMLEDVYDTFQTACKDGKFEAFKIDEHIDASKQRIVPEIIEAIQQAAFIIADVSEPKPNVYYELGWAQALGKDVIVTAKEGTQLPFDIFDVPTILYSNQKSLREALKLKIQKIGEKYGR